MEDILKGIAYHYSDPMNLSVSTNPDKIGIDAFLKKTQEIEDYLKTIKNKGKKEKLQ